MVLYTLIYREGFKSGAWLSRLQTGGRGIGWLPLGHLCFDGGTGVRCPMKWYAQSVECVPHGLFIGDSLPFLRISCAGRRVASRPVVGLVLAGGESLCKVAADSLVLVVGSVKEFFHAPGFAPGYFGLSVLAKVYGQPQVASV